jgi:hypothetical protein
MFSGADGSLPFGGLYRASDDTLLGATLAGGLGYGTIFRVGAGGVASVHHFNGADGQWPAEVMRASDGRFYGVTVGGGPGGGGT